MIYGIGTDIVSIERFERMLNRYGPRVAAHILSESEMPAYQGCVQPAAFLAKRFAAKEAFAKALGTGIRWPLTLTRIGIAHTESGRPILNFNDEVVAQLEARGVQSWHLSISDEKEFACAFVVLEAS